MRCLYCGKELALLKRWTGGGEFCSDAHRQQYQEEYNQLALNRLLQAKPRADAKQQGDATPSGSKTPADAKAAPPKRATEAPAPVREVPPQVAAPAAPPVPATEAAVPEPPLRQEPEPVEAQPPAPETVAPEPAPPPEARFLRELPTIVMANLLLMAKPELELEHSGVPSIPIRATEEQPIELAPAGHLITEPPCRAADYATRLAERGIELRDFVRGAPSVQFDVPITAASEWDSCTEPFEIEELPQPPQEAAPLWQAQEREFAGFEIELGELARVMFQDEGFDDVAVPAPVPEPSVRKNEFVVPVFSATHLAAPPPAAEAPVALSSPPQPVASAPENPQPPAFQQAPAPVPDPVTKPMPLTLHGLAAGKGKPVQLFASAVARNIGVQAPRSIALPLRPLMTLGPAPAAAREAVPAAPRHVERKMPQKAARERSAPEKTVVVKTDTRPDPKTEPKKQPPSRPDPRFGNGRVVKPDTRVLESARKSGGTTSEKEPEVRTPPPPDIPRKPVLEPQLPIDLGLPTLKLDATQSLWSRTPLLAKAGLGVVAVAFIALIAWNFKGGRKGQAAAPAPAPVVMVESGPALFVNESAMIPDWADEQGARKRKVSVLQSPIGSADYRLEFQEKIVNGALGWVFRARDRQNFYVMKLLLAKTDPPLSLDRFAVINGLDEQHSVLNLKVPATPDNVYRIRFEAVGNHFITWIENQKVDDVIDDRITIGGIGFYSERGETAMLQGNLSVVPLAVKKPAN